MRSCFVLNQINISAPAQDDSLKHSLHALASAFDMIRLQTIITWSALGLALLQSESIAIEQFMDLLTQSSLQRTAGISLILPQDGNISRVPGCVCHSLRIMGYHGTLTSPSSYSHCPFLPAHSGVLNKFVAPTAATFSGCVVPSTFVGVGLRFVLWLCFGSLLLLSACQATMLGTRSQITSCSLVLLYALVARHGSRMVGSELDGRFQSSSGRSQLFIGIHYSPGSGWNIAGLQ